MKTLSFINMLRIIALALLIGSALLILFTGPLNGSDLIPDVKIPVWLTPVLVAASGVLMLFVKTDSAIGALLIKIKNALADGVITRDELIDMILGILKEDPVKLRRAQSDVSHSAVEAKAQTSKSTASALNREAVNMLKKQIRSVTTKAGALSPSQRAALSDILRK